MRNRSKGWMIAGIVVALLFLIGIVDIVRTSNVMSLLLPIIILGGIFLLYKYPPSFLRGGSQSGYTGRTRQSQAPRKAAAPPKSKRDRSKTIPFRVIEGGKDDDDTPKYH
ncbi:MAG: hypothetical protein K0Q63_598 [Paenibacillus sp.]|nr:hypothetical protein [Paenibacillus sp.]